MSQSRSVLKGLGCVVLPLLLVVPFVVPWTSRPLSSYHYIQLLPPGMVHSIPEAMDENGQILLRAWDTEAGDGCWHNFFWTAETGFRRIPLPEGTCGQIEGFTKSGWVWGYFCDVAVYKDERMKGPRLDRQSPRHRGPQHEGAPYMAGFIVSPTDGLVFPATVHPQDLFVSVVNDRGEAILNKGNASVGSGKRLGKYQMYHFLDGDVEPLESPVDETWIVIITDLNLKGECAGIAFRPRRNAESVSFRKVLDGTVEMETAPGEDVLMDARFDEDGGIDRYRFGDRSLRRQIYHTKVPWNRAQGVNRSGDRIRRTSELRYPYLVKTIAFLDEVYKDNVLEHMLQRTWIFQYVYFHELQLNDSRSMKMEESVDAALDWTTVKDLQINDRRDIIGTSQVNGNRVAFLLVPIAVDGGVAP